MKIISEDDNMQSFFPKVISELKGIAIFMTSKEGIISTWNEGCEQLIDYKSEDVVGENFALLYPDNLIEKKYPQNELNVAESSGRYETKNWRRKKDGELFWAHEIITKVTKKDGSFIGFAMIIQDLSKMKLFQDELKEKNIRLEDTNKELRVINADLDNFVYTTSHDLKAPINNIEGLVSSLESELSSELDKSTDIKNIMNMIRSSIDKLKSNISDLAITAKIDSENKGYTEQSFKEITEDIKHSLHNQIINSKAMFYEDFSVPKIKFSRKNLRSILYNIISNAIKYRSKERNPEIRIKTEKINEYVLITIQDNGQGIKEEDKINIFSMYQRLESNMEGSGVGLAIVSKIINDNNGKIEIESEIDKGSIFKVYIKANLSF
jgi:PAS domain S-box-containing protein